MTRHGQRDDQLDGQRDDQHDSQRDDQQDDQHDYQQDDRGGLTVTAAGIAVNTATSERERVLERLHHLRSILPVFAEELASSRRQAAALRVQNRGLLEEVRRLRALHGHSHSHSHSHGHGRGGRSGTVRG